MWPSDYIHSLWWLMHHSTDSDRRAIALAHYIDDSGTHDDSTLVIMGGPVFLRDHFFEFHFEWSRTLARHGIKKPLHMMEFNQYGCFGHISPDDRTALFQDLVYLINQRKAYSLTVEVNNLDFQKFFPLSKYKGLIGAASLAFFECMLMDGLMARDHNASRKTAYVVANSSNNVQLVDAHTFIESYIGKRKALPIGSITFDTPQNVNALQAADMVAWANRHKSLGKPFTNGFEPLELLTRTVKSESRPPMVHFHYRFKSSNVESLAKVLGEPVRQKGRRQALLKALTLPNEPPNSEPSK
jgi:hypothetical protein